MGPMTTIRGIWNTYTVQQAVHDIASDPYMLSGANKKCNDIMEIMEAKAGQYLEKSTAILPKNKT